MSSDCPIVKQFIVHIGPHKTGSTALQKCLAANDAVLKNAHIVFLNSKKIHETAMLIVGEKFEKAEERFRDISKGVLNSEAHTFIISHEDLCGNLPGRSVEKSIYPNLTKSMRVIERGLQPHKVKFVFFEREENNWLESCYHQHLKHRTMFCSFVQFQEHFDKSFSWKDKLKRPKEVIGDKFIVAPYSKSIDAGVRKILEIAGQPDLQLLHAPFAANVSPSSDKVRFLENINGLSAFKKTAWFAKSLVIKDWQPRPSSGISHLQQNSEANLALIALPNLTLRAVTRISEQEVEDVLPDWSADLTEYLFDMLPANGEHPGVSRSKMQNQSKLLDYQFRGKPKLIKLNALTISYLRRNTEHNAKASHLFHRIWREQGVNLINLLPTRWLISTLQTFLDHGENEAQRTIGACGHFYGNMMKIYEGERAIEGHAPDATYPNSTPQTQNMFVGLDRFNVGGTDLMLNINALAVDLATRDDVAGLVLLELILRTKASSNVFTRMDATRRKKGIEVENFVDTWSFFEEPQ